MIGQGKPSLTKVDGENIQGCRLEVSGLVGGKIFVWQIVEVCNRNLSKYLEISSELGRKKVVGCERVIACIPGCDMVS